MNIQDIKASASEHSPAILAGLAIASCVGAVVTTAIAAKKAETVRYQVVDDARTTMVNRVRARWRYYVPSALLVVTSVSSIVAMHSVQAQRLAIVDAAYAAASSQLVRWKNAVAEHADEETKERIEVAASGASDSTEVPSVLLVSGEIVLCYDEYTGRYFRSNVETLRRVENNINSMIIHDFAASLNDYYSAIGLEDVRMGDSLGWNTDRMLDLTFGTRLSDDGIPCLTVMFSLDPIESWSRLS